QSYFLCQLNQEQLSKALFPIGHLQKSEVRKIAGELGLVTADKKDSQGLCFVGKVRLPEFLQQQLKPKKGKVYNIDPKTLQAQHAKDESNELTYQAYEIEAEMGEEIGQHNGAHYYTIGQRKGLGIGGFEEPLFVIGTNTKKNEIYTGLGETHVGLYRNGLRVAANDVHWVNPQYALSNGEELRCMARIRYRQSLQQAKVKCVDGDLLVYFPQAQKSITPGQFVAFYHEDELIGSGVIAE
ncbi:MAG: tRNA methyl transferase PRC-barrel domain-containing protein, partial [Luteibaculum sp.]